MSFQFVASIVRDVAVGIVCAAPKQHVVVRVGDLNAYFFLIQNWPLQNIKIQQSFG